MFEGLDNKTKLYIAGGITGLLGLVYLMNRPSNNGGTMVNGTVVPDYKNDTVYIPTSMYEIRVNNGEITNNSETNNSHTTNSNNQTVSDSNNQVITGDNNNATNKPVIEPVYTPPVQAETPKAEVPKAVTPTPTTPSTPSKTANTYTVDSGQTLTGIAKEIGTTVNEIVKANPTTITNPNVIKAGQVIKTPTYTPKATVTKAPTKTHTVKKGETLYSIAKKYNTTVNTIAKNNKITNVNLIKVGQVLKV